MLFLQSPQRLKPTQSWVEFSHWSHRKEQKPHFLWINLMKNTAHYGIGEDHFSLGTLKKHSLSRLYLCQMQGGEVETQRCSWWSCLRKKVTCYEWPGETLVTQNGLKVASFPSFILMFLLSGKHVLLRDQRHLFFQALKWNWKWVRAGMLLDWERQFKTNTRDFFWEKA